MPKSTCHIIIFAMLFEILNERRYQFWVLHVCQFDASEIFPMLCFWPMLPLEFSFFSVGDPTTWCIVCQNCRCPLGREMVKIEIGLKTEGSKLLEPSVCTQSLNQTLKQVNTQMALQNLPQLAAAVLQNLTNVPENNSQLRDFTSRR